MPKSNVNPSHYDGHTVTPIELIDAYGFTEGFCVGNVIKYVARAKEKNGREDLVKALWYLLYLLGVPADRIKEITEELSNAS